MRNGSNNCLSLNLIGRLSDIPDQGPEKMRGGVGMFCHESETTIIMNIAFG